MNEQLVNPPEFTNATENSKETKTFEDEEYSNYEYTIEYKKFLIPDITKLNTSQDIDPKTLAIQKMIFENFRDNLEKVLWQLQVTVKNKNTDYIHVLSTWVTNAKEKIKLNISL